MANGPFPIQLDVEFLDRLSEPVREKQVKSVSELIRTALQHYDFSKLLVVRPALVSISVRLPLEQRRELRRIARSKHTSVGQLVRTAVESYLPLLHAQSAGQLEIPMPAATATELPVPPPPPKRSRATPARKRKAPIRKRRTMTRKRTQG